MKKQPYKIFYIGCLPKKIRRWIEFHANQSQKIHVGLCWDVFITAYFNDQLEKFKLEPQQKFDDQKIIWQYWGQGIEAGALPPMVQLCFDSVDRYKQDYRVIRLDESNLHEYLDLPDFVKAKKNKSKFKIAFYSDLIRLALLDLYGGIWLDATIMLTAPIPTSLLNLDYFMYQRDPHLVDQSSWIAYDSDYFGWDAGHNVNVLNSVIIAQKGNHVIHTCLDLMLNFWKRVGHVPHYFFFQIMYHQLMNSGLLACPVMDDTLPHLLQKNLTKPFDLELYQKILASSSIHKMYYINTVSSGSFYEYLLEENKKLK